MSRSKKQAKDSTPAGTIDLAAARALLQEEALAKLAQARRRDGHPPDSIMDALREKNQAFVTPLSEEELEALVEEYRNGYVSHLTKVPIHGFMRETYPPPRFVVDQLIPRDEVTLIGGHGGTGKSILSLALAAHVACGKEWDKFKVEKGLVVFVSLEDPATQVMYRLQKIMRAYLFTDEEVGEVERHLIVIDAISHPELMVEVSEYGTHTLLPTQSMCEIEQEVKGAALVIIDNVSNAFGGNENVRRDVSAFIQHFARIARANGGGVVLLAHIDKAGARSGTGGNSYAGSSAWHNASRSRLAFVEVEGQLKLHHEKFNRSRQADPIYLTWTDDGVLIPGRSATAAASREEEAKADRDAVLRAMLAAQARGIQVPAGTRGPATTFRTLEALLEMKTFWERNGKRRFNTALFSLQSDNLIARSEDWNKQNNLRAYLALTQSGEAAARRLS